MILNFVTVVLERSLREEKDITGHHGQSKGNITSIFQLFACPILHLKELYCRAFGQPGQWKGNFPFLFPFLIIFPKTINVE